MIILGKAFADGQLPDTKGTLYTVPVGKINYCKRISLVNTNAITQTVIIYANLSGISRMIVHLSLAQWEKHILGEALVLEDGDLIEGETTTALSVDYIISGGEG